MTTLSTIFGINITESAIRNADLDEYNKRVEFEMSYPVTYLDGSVAKITFSFLVTETGSDTNKIVVRSCKKTNREEGGFKWEEVNIDLKVVVSYLKKLGVSTFIDDAEYANALQPCWSFYISEKELEGLYGIWTTNGLQIADAETKRKAAETHKRIEEQRLANNPFKGLEALRGKLPSGEPKKKSKKKQKVKS